MHNTARNGRGIQKWVGCSSVGKAINRIVCHCCNGGAVGSVIGGSGIRVGEGVVAGATIQNIAGRRGQIAANKSVVATRSVHRVQSRAKGNGVIASAGIDGQCAGVECDRVAQVSAINRVDARELVIHTCAYRGAGSGGPHGNGQGRGGDAAVATAVIKIQGAGTRAQGNVRVACSHINSVISSAHIHRIGARGVA